VVLWYHLGLGDLVLAARGIEAWARGGRIVHLPVWSRNLDTLSSLFSYIPTLQLHPISPEAQEEEVTRLSVSLNAHLVEGGRSKLLLFMELFPELGLNQLLLLTVNVRVKRLSSKSLKENLLATHTESHEMPDVVIDHHPNTPREIPAAVISELHLLYSRILYNTPEIPFMKLGHAMLSAKELHLVGSAPLCLAIATGCRPETANYWRHENGWYLKGDNEDEVWKERACLVDSTKYEVPFKLPRFVIGSSLLRRWISANSLSV